MRVWIGLLILLLLPACASSPPVITKTELVEVEVCEGTRLPVPSDLTITIAPQVVPDDATWRQLIQLLMKDRASLEVVNGRLEAIKELHDAER